MISTEEFEKAIKEAPEMSKWRDLTPHKIYQILDYLVLETTTGESMKLTVKDAEGNIMTVWAPDKVRARLEDKEYTHIRSNGLKSCRNGNSKYWSFDVVQIDGKKDMYG